MLSNNQRLKGLHCNFCDAENEEVLFTSLMLDQGYSGVENLGEDTGPRFSRACAGCAETILGPFGRAKLGNQH